MALYAFDGTGNEDRDGDDGDSNVLDFFRGYGDPQKNDDTKKERGSLYLKGIGTRARTRVGEKLAMGLGFGGHRRIRQALDRLEQNFDAGDDVIDVVGFSRGAALGLSFANEIAQKFSQLSIRYLGLWDVVGQFGLPGEHMNAGHDLRTPQNVELCFHAMALDEARLLFPLSRLTGSRSHARTTPVEVWFRGVHSDVGGGNSNRGLNWISLNWMFETAKRAGLPIEAGAVTANLKDKDLAQKISVHKAEIGPRRVFFPNDLLHASVSLEPPPPDREHNNPSIRLARIDDAGERGAAA